MIDDYRPWRQGDDEDDLLADRVSAQWRQLLDDSKRCVHALRAATAAADRHLAINGQTLKGIAGRHDAGETAHDRILRQLEQFERRLSAMEHKLSDLAGPSLLPRQIKHAA